MDQVEERNCVLGFVCLEAADHVPFHGLSKLLDLPLPLLNVVLADDVHAGGDGLRDPLVVHGLRHGHEPHVGRTPPFAQRRLGDAFAYPEDVGEYRRIHASNRKKRGSEVSS